MGQAVKNIILRDYCVKDIDDEIRWMNTETAWMQADTPWEKFAPIDPEALRADLVKMACKYPPGQMRSRMEIEVDGTHIGFVCTYSMPADFSLVGQNKIPTDAPMVRAVGIEICEPSFLHHGLGTRALGEWIKYIRDFEHCKLYLETWSGNHSMMHCAEKLGFTVCYRIPELREVNGVKYDALVYQLL